MKAVELLKEKLKTVYCLRETVELLNWDQETMMPPAASSARADQVGAVAELAHQLFTAKEIGEYLQQAQDAGVEPNSADGRLLRKVRREYERETLVPQKLAADLAAASAASRDAWMKARQANDYEIFRPWLEKVVELTRQIAKCYCPAGNLYDALLDGYEPGLKTAEVARVFAGLREGLVDLVKRIAKAKQVDDSVVLLPYSVDKQEQFVRSVITDMGYDWQRGRLDEVVHPFCCSFSTRDVRITTAYREQELAKAVFGAIHETGHALYEQGSPAEWVHTPLEGGASMGMHESQSRMWENIIGRSLPFWHYYFPKLQSVFPEQLAKCQLSEFYRAINKVQPTLIRTEADEVTYNLHIMLRFELEQALIEGSLDTRQLPEVWNKAMEEYLGIRPSDDLTGCLQDVHWSLGLIGYFPTYALGNLISAQVWQSLCQQVGNVEDKLQKGDLASIRNWLQEHIYVHGSSLLPEELIQQATRRSLEAQPFLDYLNAKYGAIYHL